MNNAMKMALVVGVAIAVDTFVLRQLFVGFPIGVFVGAFLIASVLLVFLQYLLIASSRDIFGCSKNRQNRIVENSTYPLDDFGFR